MPKPKGHPKKKAALAAAPLPAATKPAPIEEQGFVGVKVYPPMGFRPTRNDWVTRRGSPCRARTAARCAAS
jgi:hypothetical protein